jgi:hypothetical protein
LQYFFSLVLVSSRPPRQDGSSNTGNHTIPCLQIRTIDIARQFAGGYNHPLSKVLIREMDATTNDYALIVEKEFDSPGYRIMVSPVGRILRMVSIRCPNWEETVLALMTHAHYTEQSIQECNEILKNGVGHQVDRILLTEKEAEALGWLPEYNKPEPASSA